MIKCAITLHTVTVLWVYGGSRVVPYASQGVVSQFIPPPPILAELGHLTVINGVFPTDRFEERLFSNSPGVSR